MDKKWILTLAGDIEAKYGKETRDRLFGNIDGIQSTPASIAAWFANFTAGMDDLDDKAYLQNMMAYRCPCGGDNQVDGKAIRALYDKSETLDEFVELLKERNPYPTNGDLMELRGNVLTMTKDPRNRWIPMDYALAHGIDPNLAENPNALFPRMQYGRNVNNSQLSDFWKGDARYLRLQEITLSYNLNTQWLKKVNITSIDLQLIGTNIHVWSKVKNFDPEQAQFNGRVYPIPTVYSLQLYIYL